MTLFLASLLALCAASWLLGNERMLGTAIVLLANWAINTATTQLLLIPADPYAYPWAWYLATDYLSGFVLVALAGRPAMWQVIVTVLYAFECVAHGAFGLTSRTAWTEYYYWHALSKTAWLQVAVVGGWALCELAGRSGRAARRAPPAVAGMDRDSSAHPEP